MDPKTKCDICGKVDGELKALTFKLKSEEAIAVVVKYKEFAEIEKIENLGKDNVLFFLKFFHIIYSYLLMLVSLRGYAYLLPIYYPYRMPTKHYLYLNFIIFTILNYDFIINWVHYSFIT